MKLRRRDASFGEHTATHPHTPSWYLQRDDSPSPFHYSSVAQYMYIRWASKNRSGICFPRFNDFFRECQHALCFVADRQPACSASSLGENFHTHLSSSSKVRSLHGLRVRPKGVRRHRLRSVDLQPAPSSYGRVLYPTFANSASMLRQGGLGDRPALSLSLSFPGCLVCIGPE